MEKKKKKNSRSGVHFEIIFFEKLLNDNPDFVDALAPLAEAYTRAGEYDHGLNMDKRLVQIRPQDATVHYNLACSYSLTGDITNAVDALGRAVDLGYRDFRFMDEDPDLANVRADKRYGQLIADILKKRGAAHNGLDTRA